MISARLLIFVGVMAIPLWAASPGVPGAINYVEGQAAIDGEPIGTRSVGSAVLSPNQTLDTQQGKVEMLLTPGVFVRLGDNSELRMISPGLTDTQVALTRGQAMVEVTELMPENNIRVSVAGAMTSLQKPGLYAFDANSPRVSVYEGKAVVTQADTRVELGKGRETALNGNLRSRKFDRGRHGDLFAWSDVRSEYLAEASADSARTYVVDPYGWFGAGWYWNPYWSMYSFIPGDGIFYSPFGWGFYAPRYVNFVSRGWYARGGFARWEEAFRRAAWRSTMRSAPAMRAPAFHSAPAVHFGGGGSRER